MKKILLFLLFPLSLFAQDGVLKTLVAGGSVNVYTIAEALPSVYDQKERWQVIFPSTNTSTVTLQRAGLLAKAIKKPDGTALSASDLIAGSPYLISYNSNAGYYICETCGGGSGGTWGTITGALSSQTDLQSALNAKQATLVSGTNIKTVNSTSLLGSGDISVGTITSIATSNGLTGGTITGAGTISGINSAADGSTKGVASFTAADFNASSGNISLDYTNGQAASGSLKGFLSSTDWTTFNNKQNSLTAGVDYEVPLTFNNGLTRTTNTIKLGGAFTATTQIGSNGSGNFVYDNAGTIWNAGSTGLWYGTPGTYTLDYSYAAVSDKTVEIGARTQSIAKNAFLTISGVGGVQPTIKISGSTGFAGLQEAADYSANYNSLSHISKGYAVATFAPIAINGTVTSISTTSPLTGGTITTTGTIACATCVISAASLTSNALVIGGGSQASSTTTTGSGIITFVGTPSSSNFASAITDETGTGSVVFSASPTFTGTPTLPTGTIAVTQSPNNNSTAPATTAYADAAAAAIGTATPTASTVSKWDANKNFSANNFGPAYTTTAAAAGTTTFTIGSTALQYFTGTNPQTVTLPVTSTLSQGLSYIIDNTGNTGTVTVNSSGANVVVSMAGGSKATVTCILTSGTTAASWNVLYFPANPLTTLGDLLVAGASGVPSRLAASTAGYPLISNGVAAAPTYQVLTSDMVYGTQTNSSATAGYIGEPADGIQSTATNYTTTATYQQVTSMTLAPGDWEICASGTLIANSSTLTGTSNCIFVISTTTASAAGSTVGRNIVKINQGLLTGTGAEQSVSIPPYRVSISGSTTYYFNSQSTFTVGNPQFVGSIHAKRTR